MYDQESWEGYDEFEQAAYEQEWYEDDDGDYYDEHDGQPDEYTEWQDVYGGDDWDHGQYDE
jgi:hypothetical protein